MSVTTFRDIARFRRCPYAYRMDRRSGSERITLSECTELSVHDAVLYADFKRLKEGRVDRDDVMSLFWDSWDRHFPDVYPETSDTLAQIRYGERCIDNHLRGDARRRPEEVVAVGVSGTLDLPGGLQVLVGIDMIRGSGSTAFVCNYRYEPGLRSAAELSADAEMRMCALWVMRNLSGYDRVVMRWEFLGSGMSTECRASRADLESSAAELSTMISAMDADGDILPRETDYCRVCPHVRMCPRFAHEISLDADPGAMSVDDGVRLVDEYTDLQEKIDALKRRQEALATKQKVIADRIVEFADSNGFIAVTGHSGKVLVRHEKKVELPEDKTAIIERLRETGKYDLLSMVNYSRLRSDIARGEADPEIEAMADVYDVPKLYLRRKTR